MKRKRKNLSSRENKPSHNTVDDHICAFKLLIAAYDFVFAILFVRCKHGEELEDIHNLFRSNHILNADLHISKATFGFVGCCVPRAPHVNWHVNGTVSIALSFRCKVEHIRYEHSRYPLTQPRPGWTEQDPRLWWNVCCAACRRVLNAGVCDGSDIAAVELTGQMHSLVALDERMDPIRPAILWNDQRTTAQCREIRQHTRRGADSRRQRHYHRAGLP